ncbi:FAD-dependent oxidoreductase [Halobacillus sp. A5]|uniref:FAD-dependent oxidoreductase n=1 Tax=Halobacillus sp. A5 TaxID=2880263 RepID=UPI0020A6C27A|nr:FAD-dependent oxidoreductase [Halobacillus sp. A5]MCP3026483.1 FAD-dependent oxidoreductase [Halobacillus sp. A5]
MTDITIIGAGVSSVFLAYSLMNKHEGISIHVIDKGKELNRRSCGLERGESCSCEQGCSKYLGFAGLGKSEGKFNYTNDFGGELGRKIRNEKTMQLMQEVDRILCSFGADRVNLYSTKNDRLSARASCHALKVLSTEVRHLGTTLAEEIFQKMYEVLEKRVQFTFEAEVQHIEKDKNFKIETNKETFSSEKVVLATGMSGSRWFNKQTHQLGLYPGETRLDLGIRVEMRGDQLESILKDTFETKLTYFGDDYSATTYCMNPKGRVIRKYQHGLVMPDGQNQREKDSPSDNLNFTLFVPRYYATYEEAINKAESVIKPINRNSDRIVVQRLMDFKNDRSANDSRTGSIIPSLECETGRLNEEVPVLYQRALLDFFEALEGLLGERLDPDTLLYGIDAKFYEPKLYTDYRFETEVRGLYLIGDCSGETHSLSQAAASGIYLSDILTS